MEERKRYPVEFRGGQWWSGTGLGLSIVRDTVLQNGGTVEARRREPEGTCFEVCFPRWHGEEEGAE